MNKLYVWLVVFCITILLSGCVNQNNHASVKDIWRQPLKSATTYVVQRGDTLFSIAWNYDLDYRQVAALNGISAPRYHIKVGQKIKLVPASEKNSAKISQPVVPTLPQVVPEPVSAPLVEQPTSNAPKPLAVIKNSPPQFVNVRTINRCGINWAWPAQGRLSSTFSFNGLNKGIDISGSMGSPIIAAAAGKVVYAGDGLRGYGELIIIKHNDEFLSAYAHNQKLLVQEGQSVRVGQVIARMGDTEARSVMLHFEIRKAGKPVDPQQYLPAH